MQKIKINNIKIFGYHGIYNEEKKYGQIFYVDIIYVPSHKSNFDTDDLSYVIDYVEVIDFIKKIFNQNRFNLIEKLLDVLVDTLIDKFEFNYLKVRIKKNIGNICSDVDNLIIEQEVTNV